MTDTTKQSYATYHAFYQPVADVFFRSFARLVFAYQSPDIYHYHLTPLLEIYGAVIVIVALVSLVVLFLNKNKFVVILLATWFILGVLFFGFYKKPIYDYYLVFLFPLPFLLIANLIGRALDLKRGKTPYGLVIGALLFIGVFGYNLYYQPFQYPPNKQKAQMETIAKFVIQQLNNRPFNFALLSPGLGNSDYAYVYYLTILGHAPVTIDNLANDPQRKTVMDQLLVVCEDMSCKPLGNPLWDIAGFGQAAVWKSWDLPWVKVYKLVHVQTYTIKK